MKRRAGGFAGLVVVRVIARPRGELVGTASAFVALRRPRLRRRRGVDAGGRADAGRKVPVRALAPRRRGRERGEPARGAVGDVATASPAPSRGIEPGVGSRRSTKAPARVRVAECVAGVGGRRDAREVAAWTATRVPRRRHPGRLADRRDEPFEDFRHAPQRRAREDPHRDDTPRDADASVSPRPRSNLRPSIGSRGAHLAVATSRSRMTVGTEIFLRTRKQSLGRAERAVSAVGCNAPS